VNAFRYVGGMGYYLDPDTANLLLRARHYRPALARFLARDPVGLVAPLRDPHWGQAQLLRGPLAHLYAYVQGNPQAMQDPSGLLGVVLRKALAATPKAEVVRLKAPRSD
jgi:RHS repeat-associated protein